MKRAVRHDQDALALLERVSGDVLEQDAREFWSARAVSLGVPLHRVGDGPTGCVHQFEEPGGGELRSFRPKSCSRAPPSRRTGPGAT